MKHTFSLCLSIALLFSLSARAQLVRINTYAGTGISGYSGDGAAATAADLNGPMCVALDPAGNLYIADYFNARIRKVNDAGIIVTFAGTGTSGNSGNGSAATSADVFPHGVAADSKGNVYLSDPGYSVIRKINASGIISNYAGTNVPGYSGDGGSALAAKLNTPFGMAVDSRGDLYFADEGSNIIRMIDTFGIINTIAGNDTAGYSGDGGPATAARLDSPFAVAVDRMNNVYIADHRNNVIRKVDTLGNISTFAGTGYAGYTGDGSFATLAALDSPTGVAVDTAGNVFIADSYNNVIRRVDISTGFISTVAGNGFVGFAGDLGYPTGANLHNPYSVAVDTFGSIFIADANNQRIRKVYNTPLLGVGQLSISAGVAVYPNPFDNAITISGLVTSDKVCVSDMAGRIVTTVMTIENNGTKTLTLNALPEGNYMLQVWNSGNVKKAALKITKK